MTNSSRVDEDVVVFNGRAKLLRRPESPVTSSRSGPVALAKCHSGWDRRPVHNSR